MLVSKFQVIVECPRHQKNIYLIVDARSIEEAEKKVLGREISCPWGGIAEAHDFVVTEVLGVTPFPWTPPRTVSTVPISSVEVKEFTTTDLGERFWILSRKGQREFREIEESLRVAPRLAPVEGVRARGGASIVGLLLVLLLLVPVGYYLYKKFKKD